MNDEDEAVAVDQQLCSRSPLWTMANSKPIAKLTKGQGLGSREGRKSQKYPNWSMGGKTGDSGVRHMLTR